MIEPLQPDFNSIDDDGRPIFFACGPSKKFPKWKPEIFNSDYLGRTHIFEFRHTVRNLLQKMKKILQVPSDYELIFVPGSGSGALFCAFSNFLEHNRAVDCYISGYFSQQWAEDLQKQFKLETRFIEFDKLEQAKLDSDRMLVMVDTSFGLKHANYDFLPDTDDVQNSGITFVDAVCAMFIEEIPWNKFDAIAFSAQKLLGGDGSVGILAFNSRAKDRMMKPKPWPIGRLFNINKWGYEEVLNGRSMSTPSILSLVELEHILNWVEENGGIEGMRARNAANWKTVTHFLQNHLHLNYLLKNDAHRGKALVCLELNEWSDVDYLKKMEHMRKVANAAHGLKVFDIENFSCASWRFWLGPMLDWQDVAVGLKRFASVL